jgi:hypothetical protein
MPATAGLQHAEARATGGVEAQHTIQQALQDTCRIAGKNRCQLFEGGPLRAQIRHAITAA